jgi:hypothetical protein
LFPRFDLSLGLFSAVQETIGLVSRLNDVALVRQSVEERRGHLGVTKHARPFCKRQIRGDQHAGIGWDFFACSPIENRNDVAGVAPWAARFPAQIPQIPLSVISRDASARDAPSSIFNDLQAAGSISNLVGRWGMKKVRYGVPEFTLVAFAHSLMALRALADQNY